MLLGKVQPEASASDFYLPSWICNAASQITQKVSRCWENTYRLLEPIYSLFRHDMVGETNSHVVTQSTFQLFIHMALHTGLIYFFRQSIIITLSSGLTIIVHAIYLTPSLNIAKGKCFSEFCRLFLLTNVAGLGILSIGIGLRELSRRVNPLGITWSEIPQNHVQVFKIIEKCPTALELWDLAKSKFEFSLTFSEKGKTRWSLLTQSINIQGNAPLSGKFSSIIRSLSRIAHSPVIKWVWRQLENGELSKNDYIELKNKTYSSIENLKNVTVQNCQKDLPQLALLDSSVKNKNNNLLVQKATKAWNELGKNPFCQNYPWVEIDCISPVQKTSRKWIQNTLPHCLKNINNYLPILEFRNANFELQEVSLSKKEFHSVPKLGTLVEECSMAKSLWKKVKERGYNRIWASEKNQHGYDSYYKIIVVPAEDHPIYQLLHLIADFMHILTEDKFIKAEDELRKGLLTKDTFFMRYVKIRWKKERKHAEILRKCSPSSIHKFFPTNSIREHGFHHLESFEIFLKKEKELKDFEIIWNRVKP